MNFINPGNIHRVLYLIFNLLFLTEIKKYSILVIVPIFIFNRIIAVIYKKSRQRERLLELLQSTGRHPAADWLYDKLKPEFPHLSMGTVYRNLSILEKQGLIKKIDFGSTYDRFEAKITPHYHFICEVCGAIKDLEIPMEYRLEKKVEETTHMTVHNHRIEFFGICDACMAKRDSIPGQT